MGFCAKFTLLIRSKHWSSDMARAT